MVTGRKGLKNILADPEGFAVCLSLRPHYASGEPAEDLRRWALGGPAGKSGVDALFLSRRREDSGARPSADLAEEILGSGGEAVVSLCQAERSREDVLSDLNEFQARGVRSLLLVTGDYPGGEAGRGGKIPFDLDSVQLFMLLQGAVGGGEDLLRDKFAGCVVSPFKGLEAEQIWQYEKLARKCDAGAGFIVSQAGFDLRKYDELIRFCRLRKIDRPVIGSVIVPDEELAARIASGGIPGVILPPPLRERIAGEQGPGKGRRARNLRAARMTAALKDMGYRGVLLGGSINGEDVEEILGGAEDLRSRGEKDIGESFSRSPRFYYFRPGEGGALNEDRESPLVKRKRPHVMYLLSWAVDYVAFGSWEPMFRLLTRVCRFCDSRPFWKRVLRGVEFISKAPVYGCRMCGDCTLYACGFLCYESGCPKKMLNGPCGGSNDGFCEVFPGRELCFWVRVYDCLKWKAAHPTFTAPPIPPKDHGLDGTCSWINFCLGRDHRRIETPWADPPA